MATRIWRASPDLIHYTPDGGEIYHVSREQGVNALLDGYVFLDRSGGSLVVTVGRQPTEIPGEALTTGVVVQWRSGQTAKVQPEAPVSVPTPRVEPPAPEPVIEAEPVDEFDDSPDGLDEAALDDEDESAIPEALRG